MKEADLLTAKIDLLMKRLDDQASEKKEVMLINDSRMTCEECGDVGHMGKNCPTMLEDANYINNNNYRPQNQWNHQQQQGWRPNYQGNYPGNYNNNTFNQPPLRELVANQTKTLEQLSKKISANDKVLENVNTRMDSLATAIKNQHSFNKMVESHISQLALNVPAADRGKIPGQPDELESANLVDIYYVGCYNEKPAKGWEDDTMPAKKGDPGRPVIPISIGPYDFQEALCDFGASINIMRKVIYKKIHGSRL